MLKHTFVKKHLFYQFILAFLFLLDRRAYSSKDKINRKLYSSRRGGEMDVPFCAFPIIWLMYMIVHFGAFFSIMFSFTSVQSSSMFYVSWTNLLSRMHLHKFPLLAMICRAMKFLTVQK